jgi:asparaginyl-tRNA synthetase
MKQVTIANLFKKIPRDSQQIVLSGWVRTVRDSKAFAFIELNDGTSLKNLQVVCDHDLPNFEEVKRISLYSSIEVEGHVVLTPDMKQPFELKAIRVVMLGKSDADYPLQKKRHTTEYLRTIAHLRPRTNLFSAVFRIRSLVAQALHAFFAERGFVYVNTPIITTSDAEGAGEMFRVTTLDFEKLPQNSKGQVDFSKDFFGNSAFLTVSGQLQAEAYALAFRNIYTFGPTFRAENSNTPRHAAEFWMLEPEISFADLNDCMDLAEEMVRWVLSRVMEQAQDELSFLNQFLDKDLLNRLNFVKNSAFARCSYTQAIDILKASGKNFEYSVKWGMDLQTEHERYLSEVHFQSPVFVTDYPKDIKAFYMRMNDDEKTVAAMDLLVPGVGELIGGSQREERYDYLLRRIHEMSLPEEEYVWYLDLRRFGTAKHAGFGLGFERFVMYLTGINNIRDVIPFPRTVGHANF